jgi:hypothetical protein
VSYLNEWKLKISSIKPSLNPFFNMRLDESKCEYQTMSLFGDGPKTAAQPVNTPGKAEIYFDGGCLGNPGQKYGSFQVKLDGTEVLKRSRVDFGFGTNNEAEFNALKLALDEAVRLLQEKAVELTYQARRVNRQKQFPTKKFFFFV